MDDKMILTQCEIEAENCFTIISVTVCVEALRKISFWVPKEIKLGVKTVHTKVRT